MAGRLGRLNMPAKGRMEEEEEFAVDEFDLGDEGLEDEEGEAELPEEGDAVQEILDMHDPEDIRAAYERLEAPEGEEEELDLEDEDLEDEDLEDEELA